MKKNSIYTIAILAMMIIGVGFVAPADIRIVLTEQEAGQYSEKIAKATQIINDSDMNAKERKDCKELLNSAQSLLISKVVKDTVKTPIKK